MKKALVVAVAIAATQLVPAAAQGNRECKPEDVSRRIVVSRESYGPDEPVRMQLIVKNTSGETCSMGFPSGRGGTVRVFKQGNPVWEHGYCRAYTAHFEFATWEPGHREAYRFRWRHWMNAQDGSGLNCDGKRYRASSGRYEVVGEFFGTEPNAKTETGSFHLTR